MKINFGLICLFGCLLTLFPASCQTDLSPTPSELQSIIGRTVYATGMSRLYDPSASFEEMQQPISVKRYLTGWEALNDFCHDRMCQGRRIPLLTPFTVTDVKYLSERHAYILTLRLPNQQRVISLTTKKMLKGGHTRDFLNQICGFLLPEIPDNLSAHEISAIKERKLIPGLSKNAVVTMLGAPLGDSEWQKGRKLSYSRSLIIYLDNKNEVVSVITPGMAREIPRRASRAEGVNAG